MIIIHQAWKHQLIYHSKNGGATIVKVNFCNERGRICRAAHIVENALLFINFQKVNGWEMEKENEQIWPKKCPSCGNATDMTNFWYIIEPHNGEDWGICWDCDYPHPVLHRLKKHDKMISDLEKEIHDLSDENWKLKKHIKEIEERC